MNSCRIALAGETTSGRVRPFNEDNFCVAGAPDAPVRLAVVADGLGGHEGGAHASFVCCRSFLHSWRKGHAAIDSAVAAERFLRSAIIAANDAVFAFNHGCRERPMG
ncbi:MAG: hypothetical protein IKA55_05890, partial [Akkermansia sp.]|nr:hypothetical protein [Akkermansia sp.]